MNQKLNKNREQLEKIDKFVKISKMYGGQVKIGDDLYKTHELEELRDYLKGEIAVEISQRVLRLVQ